MQDAQPDPKECRRVGVGEQFINFRPSPNTGVIKKFRKVNLEGSESSLPGDIDMKHSVSPEHEVKVKEEPSSYQPPLPPDSPPRARLASPAAPAATPAPAATDTTDNKWCRDFIRGNCTRAGCKYPHDPTQRQGVYTFCRKFQNANSECTYQHCKFVHATVFEEQAFYRTGVLPPHTVAHQKRADCGAPDMTTAMKLLLTPPPPPPAAALAAPAPTAPIDDTSNNILNPPLPQSKPSGMALVTVIPEASVGAGIGNSLAAPWSDPTSSPDEALGDTTTASGIAICLLGVVSVGDADDSESECITDLICKSKDYNILSSISVTTVTEKSDESDTSNCDSCVVNENRYQHYLAKVASMTDSLQEMTQQMQALDEKERRLNAVIHHLSREMSENPNSGLVNPQLTNLLNNIGPDEYLQGRKG